MEPIIHTFDSWFGNHPKYGVADMMLVAFQNPSSEGDQTMPSGMLLNKDVVAVARVDHSRWIADCPDPECGGAEFVSFADPRFFCCECRNKAIDHAYLPVELPSTTDRGDIEELLLARSSGESRNWLPSETVDDLLAQNRAHGVEPKPKG